MKINKIRISKVEVKKRIKEFLYSLDVDDPEFYISHIGPISCKPYVILKDKYSEGCHLQEVYFETLESANAIIRKQLVSNKGEKWDCIYIFNIIDNRVETVGLQ